MNVYVGNRLPSTYQEVEYIQSSGTQYIVIGTSFKASYKTVIDFQMTVIGGDYIPLGIKYSTNRYGIDAYNSNFMVNGGGQTWANTISEDTNRHTITIDKGTAIVDGNNYNVAYTNYTFSQGIGVFCYNEYDKSSQYTYKSSNKLYKLDIYDENGTHIYDLVPCYRKSDNVIGLYDLVNNQFYTNAGTGTFSKGSNVLTNATLKNAYIGEVHTYTFDFQNDGSLNWTAKTVYGTPTLTSGQGWTIGSSSTGSYQSAVMPPSSLYDGCTLKKFRIWVYKGVNAYIDGTVSKHTVGCGPSSASCGQSSIWESTYFTSVNPSIANVYDGTDHFIVTSGKTGELVLEYIFNDDGSLILSVDGTEYNLGNYATMFRNLWTNQDLGLTIGRWSTSNGQIYVRKVEITTVG